MLSRKHLLLLASLLIPVGCSSSEDAPIGVTDSGVDAVTDADAATETCSAAGGICIALTATSMCPEGRESPNSSAIRCAGAGSMCCVPKTITDAGGDSAPDSSPDAVTNVCAAKGGTCIAVTPTAVCPTGTAESGDTCTGVGTRCCLPSDAGTDAATD